MLKQTPSQTIGPFFAFSLTPEQYGHRGIAGNVLVDGAARGQRIRIHGQVTDGADQPVTDAMLEVWQADASGCYNHPADGREADPAFRGFGRCATDVNGMYSFLTVKPGRVPHDDSGVLQAPHINLVVFLRGILVHAYTRIYFSDDADAHAEDAVLSAVDQARRSTLLAQRDEHRSVPRYRFDIHLQGPDETVFFDV